MLERFPEGEGWVCEGDRTPVVGRPNLPPNHRTRAFATSWFITEVPVYLIHVAAVLYFVIRVPIFPATASVAPSSGPMITCGFAARDARMN